MKKPALLLCAFVLALVMAVPAWAGIKEDWDAALAALDRRDFQTVLNLTNRLIQYGKLNRPSLARVHTVRGVAYRFTGNHQAALADFYKAIEANPQFSFAYFQRGNTWIEQQKWDYAMWDFSKAIQLNPRLADAYWNRSVCFQKKGQMAEAMRDQQTYCQLTPNDPKGRERLAFLQNRGGGQAPPPAPGGYNQQQQPNTNNQQPGGYNQQQPANNQQPGGNGGFRLNSGAKDLADNFDLKEK